MSGNSYPHTIPSHPGVLSIRPIQGARDQYVHGETGKELDIQALEILQDPRRLLQVSLSIRAKCPRVTPRPICSQEGLFGKSEPNADCKLAAAKKMEAATCECTQANEQELLGSLLDVSDQVRLPRPSHRPGFQWRLASLPGGAELRPAGGELRRGSGLRAARL